MKDYATFAFALLELNSALARARMARNSRGVSLSISKKDSGASPKT
jgi:hypothetical protein